MRFFALVRFFLTLSSLNSGNLRAGREGAQKLHQSRASFHLEIHQNEEGKKPDFLGQVTYLASPDHSDTIVSIATNLGNCFHAVYNTH